jgi:hypothetical protein
MKSVPLFQQLAVSCTTPLSLRNVEDPFGARRVDIS